MSIEKAKETLRRIYNDEFVPLTDVLLATQIAIDVLGDESKQSDLIAWANSKSKEKTQQERNATL